MSAPTVSAVIRVYNGEAFMGETVDAILAQTRPPEEVIVVDDGSTDGTADLLRGFGKAIRVVRQANSGVAAGFNRAFAEAHGDYVAVCDADDVWEADKLERQMAAVRAHPEVDLAFGAVTIFGTDDGSWGHFDVDVAGVLEGDRFRNDLFRTNAVTTSTVLLRRALQERLGPFEEYLGAAEDYDYWLRAAGAGAVFYYDPTVLARYRRHGEQMTNGTLRVHRAMLEVRRRRSQVPNDQALVRAVLAANYFKIGRLLVEEERPHEARTAFRRAARCAGRASASTASRAVLWAAILALPSVVRDRTGPVMVELSRTLDSIRGGRDPALP